MEGWVKVTTRGKTAWSFKESRGDRRSYPEGTGYDRQSPQPNYLQAEPEATEFSRFGWKHLLLNEQIVNSNETAASSRCSNKQTAVSLLCMWQWSIDFHMSNNPTLSLKGWSRKAYASLSPLQSILNKYKMQATGACMHSLTRPLYTS